MANTVSSFISFFLLLLLLHLGCFFIFTKSHNSNTTNNKKTKHKRRKITPLSPISPISPISSSLSPSSSSSSSQNPRKSFSSSLSYIIRFISPSNRCKSITTAFDPSPPSSFVSATSSAAVVPNPSQLTTTSTNQIHPRSGGGGGGTTNDSLNISSSSDNYFFPLRNNMFPCTSCGEVFNNPSLLEHHKSVKHAVTELTDGDTGNNIVRIIFNTGWNSTRKKIPTPIIKRILKVHNSPKILFRFEEYRELVKAKAARNGEIAGKWRDERCIADGNELLRFHCTTFLCELGHDGNSDICNGQYCSVCGIVRSGFSQKMDGISTLSSSWKAHESIPGEIEEEFKFMNVKRAMLVCRVIAGRVGSDQDEPDKTGCGYDSVVGSGGSGVHIRDDEDELLVFNPRAVLPCFVIVYTL